MGLNRLWGIGGGLHRALQSLLQAGALCAKVQKRSAKVMLPRKCGLYHKNAHKSRKIWLIGDNFR